MHACWAAGPGVILADCTGCTLEHNHVHDFYYTGITTGLGFHDRLIHDCALRYNHIQTIGARPAADGTATSTLFV